MINCLRVFKLVSMLSHQHISVPNLCLASHVGRQRVCSKLFWNDDYVPVETNSIVLEGIQVGHV